MIVTAMLSDIGSMSHYFIFGLVAAQMEAQELDYLHQLNADAG